MIPNQFTELSAFLAVMSLKSRKVLSLCYLTRSGLINNPSAPKSIRASVLTVFCFQLSLIGIINDSLFRFDTTIRDT